MIDDGDRTIPAQPPPEPGWEETRPAMQPDTGSWAGDELPNIPGVEISRRIGAGGMGSVFLALEKALHRYVAIKVLSPHLLLDQTSLERSMSQGRIVHTSDGRQPTSR